MRFREGGGHDSKETGEDEETEETEKDERVRRRFEIPNCIVTVRGHQMEVRSSWC